MFHQSSCPGRPSCVPPVIMPGQAQLCSTSYRVLEGPTVFPSHQFTAIMVRAQRCPTSHQFSVSTAEPSSVPPVTKSQRVQLCPTSHRFSAIMERGSKCPTSHQFSARRGAVCPTSTDSQRGETVPSVPPFTNSHRVEAASVPPVKSHQFSARRGSKCPTSRRFSAKRGCECPTSHQFSAMRG